MLTEDRNRLLTEVGPGTPMGRLLRHYWMPIAGASEFEGPGSRPVRLMGEDLLLFRDGQGQWGLIDRHCAHRRADLSDGFVEDHGVRCVYHGWTFDVAGRCVEQPYEDEAIGRPALRERFRVSAYPVREKGGLLWAYLGPQPAPELPDWEPFSWPDGYVQVVFAELPCNWFQTQENSIDPVHFEWAHDYWSAIQRGGQRPRIPRHLKLAFDEFEHGFTYRRVREGGDESDEAWTIGRVFLWPNGFFLGEHFEWRVPIDDENTLSVTWKYQHVPRHREPYVQPRIPAWHGPIKDASGRWITSHVMNQDFVAWAGQGRIADRTKENLSASDQGIAAVRRRFFEELDAMDAGKPLKAVFRDPALNVQVPLPMMGRADVVRGHTVEEIAQSPRLRRNYTMYPFQAGQPEEVRAEFEAAMGLQGLLEPPATR